MRKHPNSDALRHIADWLDQSGAYLTAVGVHFKLTDESPATFSLAVGDINGRVDASMDHTVFVHGKLFEMAAILISEKSRVGREKSVTRNEFVIGGAA